MQCPSVERTFCNLLYVYGRGRRSSSRTAHRLRLRSSPIRSLRRSSSPKKVTLRLCCSLVNALVTCRLATNFFRYQAVRCRAFPLVGNAHRAFRSIFLLNNVVADLLKIIKHTAEHYRSAVCFCVCCFTCFSSNRRDCQG